MLLQSPFKLIAARAARIARRARGFVVDRTAATAVEFAMIAAPFFMIFCAIFESAFLVFNQGNLEAATYAVSRQLLTGSAPVSADLFRNALCDKTVSGILGSFDCQNTSKMFIDVRNAADFTTNPAAGQSLFTAASNTYSPGTAGTGAVVVLRVGYIYPLYFTGAFSQFGKSWSLNSWGGSGGSATRNMTATVVFKSE